jgi:23S rRNA pseudouridine1911/1915/1917 synthase
MRRSADEVGCTTVNNRGYEYRETVDPQLDGQVLLDYLSRRYVHSSVREWRDRIEGHRVLVDGRVASPQQVLRRGQVVTWHRPAWQEPDVPRSFAVLYEDTELLAVAKPRGLPTMPGGGFLDNTLLAVAREYAPGVVPVHRLGRWTSGLVLFARTPRARSHLARSWREQRVQKHYLALASGHPRQQRFDVTTPIGTVPYAPLGLLHAASPTGKRSVSHVEVAQQRAEDFVAQVTIDTGRPHQIRIHLASVGHPLVGDPLYGPGGLPLPGTCALPGDPGYLLHARSLVFEHPSTHAEIELICREPPSLRTPTP